VWRLRYAQRRCRTRRHRRRRHRCRHGRHHHAFRSATHPLRHHRHRHRHHLRHVSASCSLLTVQLPLCGVDDITLSFDVSVASTASAFAVRGLSLRAGKDGAGARGGACVGGVGAWGRACSVLGEGTGGGGSGQRLRRVGRRPAARAQFGSIIIEALPSRRLQFRLQFKTFNVPGATVMRGLVLVLPPLRSRRPAAPPRRLIHPTRTQRTRARRLRALSAHVALWRRVARRRAHEPHLVLVRLATVVGFTGFAKPTRLAPLRRAARRRRGSSFGSCVPERSRAWQAGRCAQRLRMPF
jgi:hypothetical protein